MNESNKGKWHPQTTAPEVASILDGHKAGWHHVTFVFDVPIVPPRFIINQLVRDGDDAIFPNNDIRVQEMMSRLLPSESLHIIGDYHNITDDTTINIVGIIRERERELTHKDKSEERTQNSLADYLSDDIGQGSQMSPHEPARKEMGH